MSSQLIEECLAYIRTNDHVSLAELECWPARIEARR